MAVSRAAAVEGRFRSVVEGLEPGPRRTDLDSPVRDHTALTARRAIQLFEAQLESRLLDLLSRRLKQRGESFYTIGSAGHEGNAVVAAATRTDDLAFLHYRSGAFFLARANAAPGTAGAFDMLLGMVASADEPIAGGRHKVFGSVELSIPPQTSTIASHLPKALGCAVAIDRRSRLTGTPDDRIVVCTFGDASSNHASATTALNAAAWTSYQRVPAPVLFVCEDNGYGISVRTPKGWVQARHSANEHVPYAFADGLDLPAAYDAAQAMVHQVRTTRAPGFLHLRTVRLLGHAGSDVEQAYRTLAEIEETERRDPLLRTAELLVSGGWMSPHEILTLADDLETRLEALAAEAVRRPKLTNLGQVVQALHPPAHMPEIPVAQAEERRGAFGEELPEDSDRPRHLAFQINRALTDAMLAVPETVLFGEDVARKGGVYHVTAGLTERLGVGRVFNTLLDETTILGLAIGAAHAGLLPIPEVQYLAYLMNAIDQLRGEAGSMQFFSQGKYTNPMVLRIASFAYQRGFGGHFHNDNGIAALLEIPGLVIGTPAKGDDAVRMLRTMVGLARSQGRVCVLLEPIALYMTRDLHDQGDGAWLTPYPPPDEGMPPGEVGTWRFGAKPTLCIVSYANGLRMSLRVAKRLFEEHGHASVVVDLRWLQPLPIDAVAPFAQEAGKLLVVDECRANSGIADTLIVDVLTKAGPMPFAKVTGHDTYIPLGAAANLVLVQEEGIEEAALGLLEGR